MRFLSVSSDPVRLSIGVTVSTSYSITVAAICRALKEESI